MLQVIGRERLSPQFVEAKGSMSGLTDRLYMRRDRAEHSASVAVAAWAHRFSLVAPVENIYKELSKSHESARKAVVLAYLTTALDQHHELDKELQGVIATANARLAAEARRLGSILNRHKGVNVPDLDDTHKAELAKIQKSGSYRRDIDPTVGLILSGLAGDVAVHYGAQVNAKDTEDATRTGISSTLALGAGAIFYLGMTSHAAYADAQLQHIQDAGEKVDFITSGDSRVCSLCLSAEDGNPYAPDDVPPIPYHGGCRCWYAPAGAIT